MSVQVECVQTRLAVAGYDIVATAQVAEGGGPPYMEEVLVLNNNADLFLVGYREREGTHVTIVATCSYGADEHDQVAAYTQALRLMAQLALEN